MTAAMSVPFSADESAEYVIQRSGVRDEEAKQVIGELVRGGFSRMEESNDPDREERWSESVVKLASRWSVRGTEFGDSLRSERNTLNYVEPDVPPVQRALQKIGVCPLWPFC